MKASPRRGTPWARCQASSSWADGGSMTRSAKMDWRRRVAGGGLDDWTWRRDDALSVHEDPLVGGDCGCLWAVGTRVQ